MAGRRAARGGAGVADRRARVAKSRQKFAEKKDETVSDESVSDSTVTEETAAETVETTNDDGAAEEKN